MLRNWRGQHYGPMSYYSLGRTYGRTRLREPFPMKRKRFLFPPFDSIPRRICRTGHPRPETSTDRHGRVGEPTTTRLPRGEGDTTRHPRSVECADERR
jgi:hypothetical protein